MVNNNRAAPDEDRHCQSGSTTKNARLAYQASAGVVVLSGQFSNHFLEDLRRLVSKNGSVLF